MTKRNLVELDLNNSKGCDDVLVGCRASRVESSRVSHSLLLLAGKPSVSFELQMWTEHSTRSFSRFLPSPSNPDHTHSSLFLSRSLLRSLFSITFHSTSSSLPHNRRTVRVCMNVSTTHRTDVTAEGDSVFGERVRYTNDDDPVVPERQKEGEKEMRGNTH